MTTSPLANPTATRELLEEFGLATKHRLGQNFLIDNHVIERICELSELAGDERVREVGPGVGTLTRALLQEAACVTSIEADPELEPVLDAHAADYANFCFIMGDALKVGPEQIEQAAGGEPTVFVANLPYNVAATIILQFFQTMPALKRAVVMVQKEVAERMQAGPGGKDYGALSLAVQYYAEPYIVANVPPNCFMPRPNVGSAVIRLTRHTEPKIVVKDEKFMFKLIRASFNQRRKTLQNGINNSAELSISKDAVVEALRKMGLSESIRGEALTLAQFAELSDLLCE